MSWTQRLIRFYFTIDLRSLGLFRILFAGVLIYDWALRWPNLEAFYTSFGVLPIESPLPKAGGVYHFSLLDGFTSLPMVQFAFLCGLIFYVGLLLGYRTRLFQILSCLFLISVINRNTMIRTGGDIVMVTMSIWGLFLPLGARFSLDAVRASLRRERAGGSSRSPLAETGTACRPSLAAFAAVLQIGLIYFLTAVDKTGETWWSEGTAVYYAMHVDQFATPAARWLTEAPLPVVQFLTWSSLLLEYAVLPLILLPIFQPWLRRLAIVSLVGLHMGIWVTMHLGNFPFVMMSLYALLLMPRDWQQIGQVMSRFSRPVTLYFDEQCPLSQGGVRLVTVLDRFQRIRMVPLSEAAEIADGTELHRLRQEVQQWGIVVYDEANQVLETRSAALAAIAGGLPLPFHILRLIRLPGIAFLADEGFSFVSARRASLAAGLGWKGETVFQQADCSGAGALEPPWLLRLRDRGFGLVETAAAGFVLTCVLYASYNYNLSRAWKWERVPEPEPIRAFTLATQLLHDWHMFAPNPMRNDGWWVIEGETLSGKKIDPLTGREPDWTKPASQAAMFDVSWRKYLSRINEGRHRDHRLYLGKYLTRRNHRDTPPEERLRRFHLYFVQERTQPPGSSQPFPTRRIHLWRHECFPVAANSAAGAVPLKTLPLQGDKSPPAADQPPRRVIRLKEKLGL